MYDPSTSGHEPAPHHAPRPARPDSPRPVMAPRPARRSLLPLGSILGLMLAFALVAGGVLDSAASAATDFVRGTSATPTAQTATQDDTGTAVGSDVEAVAAAANPAVVTVSTYTDQATSTSPFGQQSEDAPTNDQGDTLYGTGSGFIWDADGHVITNAHVVNGGSSFTVTFYDGTTVDATLVGDDTYADVAVLQVKLGSGQELPAVAKIGTSADVVAGEGVVAIGSPYGTLTNTVSEGIVGATGRELPVTTGVYDLTNLIQHDAAIYPGNSGGPLLNMAGEVIGINVATLADTQTGQASGIGFALSIDSVRPFIEQIISTGSVERPYLGVSTQVTRDGSQMVADIDSDGPSAGVLEAGDEITAIDGTDVSFDAPFLNDLFQYDPGDKVTLTIERDGTSQEVSVTLGERPAEAA